MRTNRSSYIWMALGGLALLFRYIGGLRPDWVETYYSRGLFLAVRYLIDYLLAWLPVPLIYLFFAGLIFYISRSTRRWWRKEQDLKARLLSALAGSGAFLGGGIFLFLFLWGYNYARTPIEDQLQLSVAPLSTAELWEELQSETAYIVTLREAVPGATEGPLDGASLPKDLENRLRNDLKQWLQASGYPVPGRVRGRLLYPRGIFLRFSSAGLYWPFTGEGHADAGLHPLQLPSVLAHELGHGYGFGDEGTCSFLAYVSNDRSEDPFIRYAGHLDHWRTLAANYRLADPEGFQDFYTTLPTGIKADLEAIYETMRRYPDLMPRLRYAFYENYLKAQGIEEGMKNYNRVVMLVHAWREQNF